MVVLTPEAETIVEDAKKLVGREDAEFDVYELSGAYKPLGWGDEAVLVDMDYLRSIPRDLAVFAVAERVEQVAHQTLTQQRRDLAMSLAAGAVFGGAWLYQRRGSAHSLRRVFTGNIAVSTFTFMALSAGANITSTSALERTAQYVKQRDPSFILKVHDHEQNKLIQLREDAIKLRDDVAKNNGIITDKNREHDAAIVLGVREVDSRVAAIRKYIPEDVTAALA